MKGHTFDSFCYVNFSPADEQPRRMTKMPSPTWISSDGNDAPSTSRHNLRKENDNRCMKYIALYRKDLLFSG